MTAGEVPPYELGPMPLDRRMTTIDEQLVQSPARRMFDLARDVEKWPEYLAHYRDVRFRDRRDDGGGLVEMSANRPFRIGSLQLNWPTWWLSEMSVNSSDNAPSIRFRHVGGITKGMDVEWTFAREGNHSRVRIVHVWNGPRVPVVGALAAQLVVGPVFIHGIASRTLAGLAAVAERWSRQQQ